MASYKLSAEAKQDLRNIYRHGILQFGEQQAEKYFDALIARFEQIAIQPNLYPTVDHIRKDYRRCVCGRDSIYYRVSAHVEIMRVIGQQDV